MAYTEDKLPSGLDALTSVASTDVHIIGDTSDDNRAKKITDANLVTDLESKLNHDSLVGFVANEHTDHSVVSITAGAGLSGGGTITSTRTLNVNINGANDLGTPASGDEILISDIDDAHTVKKTDLATAVDNAGAVMNTDTSTASMSFVIDEDNMVSDSATKVPTQQSVKAYVDADTSLYSVSSSAQSWYTTQAGFDNYVFGNASFTNKEMSGTIDFTGGGYANINVPANGSNATLYDTNNGGIRLRARIKFNDAGGRAGWGLTSGNGSEVADTVAQTGGQTVRFTTVSGVIYAVSTNATNVTSTDVDSGITDTDWNDYLIVMSPGVDVKYYINGTLVATHSSNIPSGAMEHMSYGGSTSSVFIYTSRPIVSIQN